MDIIDAINPVNWITATLTFEQKCKYAAIGLVAGFILGRIL